MGSILDLNMCSIVISDLNKEINYKLGEYQESESEDLLSLVSDGNNHSIIFLGQILWDSIIERTNENIPVEIELSLNEQDKFEKHLKMLIMDKINVLKHLEV